MALSITLTNNHVAQHIAQVEQAEKKPEAVIQEAGFLSGKKFVPISAGHTAIIISLLASAIIIGVGTTIAAVILTPAAIAGGVALILGAIVLFLGSCVRQNRKNKAFLEELKNKI